MMKVKITSGIYGYRKPGAKRPDPKHAGDVVDLPDEEAVRLKQLKVGVILGTAEDYHAEPVATPAEGEGGAGAGVDTPGQNGPAEGNETAHLDPEQLKELTNAKLKELAEEMGINTAKLKTKAQLIAAITDVPLEDAIFGEEDGDDDEGSPSGLGAEEPVE